MAEGRTGDGLVGTFECCVAEIESQVAPSGASDVLVVLGEDFVQVAAAEASDDDGDGSRVLAFLFTDDGAQLIQRSCSRSLRRDANNGEQH